MVKYFVTEVLCFMEVSTNTISKFLSEICMLFVLILYIPVNSFSVMFEWVFLG